MENWAQFSSKAEQIDLLRGPDLPNGLAEAFLDPRDGPIFLSGNSRGIATAERSPGGCGESSLPARQWLASPYLARAARRVAWQYHLSAEDASDLLQELSLALWKAGPDTRINPTWIFHTAAHKAIDFLRQRGAAGLPAEDRIAATAEGPAELLHLLHARVDGLPRHLRQFYTLRFEQGLSQRETARELGLLRGFVRSLDQKCLTRIRGKARA